MGLNFKVVFATAGLLAVEYRVLNARAHGFEMPTCVPGTLLLVKNKEADRTPALPDAWCYCKGDGDHAYWLTGREPTDFWDLRERTIKKPSI